MICHVERTIYMNDRTDNRLRQLYNVLYLYSLFEALAPQARAVLRPVGYTPLYWNWPAKNPITNH
jgi:hypothetical protein